MFCGYSQLLFCAVTYLCFNTVRTVGKIRGGIGIPVPPFVALTNTNELRISDNPTLVVNERQPVTLVCQFSTVKNAILREIVWYREFEDGRNVKLLTYDAIMNISQVNDIAHKNIKARGPFSLEIDVTSPADDGWYQCHVGVYVNRRIVEKIGYIYLNVLVPPTAVSIAVHASIEGSAIFNHNFSMVCRVEKSKPAASLTFTRNGIEIAELNHINSSLFVNEIAESYADLLNTKGPSFSEVMHFGRTAVAQAHEAAVFHESYLKFPVDQYMSENVEALLTTGHITLSRNGLSGQTIQYTLLHLKAEIGDTGLWESASYLLWTLYPEFDTEAEYGCLAKHQSLGSAKSALETLRPPTSKSLEIEVKPDQPSPGSNIILQLNEVLLQNIFPKPVLLWTADKGYMNDKQKFYVGNKLLLRNVRRNNTKYRVQAFNALGSASSTKIITLNRGRKTKTSFYDQKGGKRNNATKTCGRAAFLLVMYISYFVLIGV